MYKYNSRASVSHLAQRLIKSLFKGSAAGHLLLRTVKCLEKKLNTLCLKFMMSLFGSLVTKTLFEGFVVLLSIKCGSFAA